MKKITMFFTALIFIIGLAACDSTSTGEEPDDPNNPKEQTEEYEDRISLGTDEDLCGPGKYVVIEGECIEESDFTAPNTTVGITQNHVSGLENDIQLLDEMVADLSGSEGLGVVSEDVYDEQKEATEVSTMSLSEMDMSEEEVEDNVIVKLTEEGFFEEVSFTDENGESVEITSNPIALEVFGAFSVVIFEVENSWEEDRDYNQQLWDAKDAGAMYLIHNDSGKVFPLFEVTTEEEEYVETHEWQETRNVTATVGEPVTYTYEDQESEETVEETLVGPDGEEIIFEEGPIVTEIEERQLFETFKVLKVDENGDAVLDEEGEPVYETIEEPALDDNGDPIYVEEEVAVLDDDGEPVREETFDTTVEVLITEEYKETHYHATIEETPLSAVARSFIDRILADYYDWNYYRVNEYTIDYSNLVYSDEHLYYQLDQEGEEQQQKKVMQLSYDNTEEELVAEEFLNMTKAQMTECRDILMDPIQNVLVCDPRDHTKDLTIYSDEEGLMTLDDTQDVEPLILPNGTLYYYFWETTEVDDLGYDTRALHTITPEGDMVPTYVELGKELRQCNWDGCVERMNYDLYDENGDLVLENQDERVSYEEDEYYIDSADLRLVSIENAETQRSECEDEEHGCHFNTRYEIFDGDELFVEFSEGDRYYPGEAVPPVKVVYEMSEDTVIDTANEYSQEDKICENEDIGCENDFSLIDSDIGDDDVWIYSNRIVDAGEKMIDQMYIKDDHNGVYDYTRDYSGELCQDTSCEEYVTHEFYDDSGELVDAFDISKSYEEGETIPLRIEYHQNENTVLEGEQTSENDGYWYPVEFIVGDATYNRSVRYDRDETFHDTIEYDSGSANVITEETVERETCETQGGCDSQEIEYTIEDANGDVVFELSRSHYTSYGDKVPFEVSLTLDDLDIVYEKVQTEEDKICEEDQCRTDFSIYIGDEHLGWVNDVAIENGENYIQRVTLSEAAEPLSESYENICTNPGGCYRNVSDLVILDSEGERINQVDENHRPHVNFPEGFGVPLNDDVTVTYEIMDSTYIKDHIRPDIINNNIEDSLLVDEDLILIQSDNNHNYIMDIDGANTYFRIYTTNLPQLDQIHAFGDGYLGVNKNKTAIHYFEYDESASDEDHMAYTVETLTDGHDINAVENIDIAYDGTIYFDAIDNHVQDIAGTITPDGEVIIDTTYIEREIIRIRPLN